MWRQLNLPTPGPRPRPQTVHIRHTASRHNARVHAVRVKRCESFQNKDTNFLAFEHIPVHESSVPSSHATFCLRHSVVAPTETVELKKYLVTLPVAKPRWNSEGVLKI